MRLCGFSERWIAERLGLSRFELKNFCKRYDLPKAMRKKPLGSFVESIKKLESVEIRVGEERFVMGWSMVEPMMGKPTNWQEIEQLDQLTRLAGIKHRQAMHMRGIPLEEKAKMWEEHRAVEDGLKSGVGVP